MKARLDSVLHDAVLSYCFDRTLSGYDQAMHYGRLSGFFTFENELTALGKKFAQSLKNMEWVINNILETQTPKSLIYPSPILIKIHKEVLFTHNKYEPKCGNKSMLVDNPINNCYFSKALFELRHLGQID